MVNNLCKCCSSRAIWQRHPQQMQQQLLLLLLPMLPSLSGNETRPLAQGNLQLSLGLLFFLQHSSARLDLPNELSLLLRLSVSICPSLSAPTVCLSVLLSAYPTAPSVSPSVRLAVSELASCYVLFPLHVATSQQQLLLPPPLPSSPSHSLCIFLPACLHHYLLLFSQIFAINYANFCQ